MKCPKCQTENPETRKFCRRCGAQLILLCPQCSCENLPGDRFCGECGHKLDFPLAEEKPIPEAESERKHVTVLFSDLSGYTTMTEKLDSEEVKEIMSRIFGEIAKVVIKYEGFIERFSGQLISWGSYKISQNDIVKNLSHRKIFPFSHT